MQKLTKKVVFSQNLVRNFSCSKTNFDLNPEWISKPRLEVRKIMESEIKDIIDKITVKDGYQLPNPLDLIIADRTLKFKIVTACEKQWQQEIPSYELKKIEYPKDIVKWYLDFIDTKRKPKTFKVPQEVEEFINQTESDRLKKSNEKFYQMKQ